MSGNQEYVLSLFDTVILIKLIFVISYSVAFNERNDINEKKIKHTVVSKTTVLTVKIVNGTIRFIIKFVIFSSEMS